MSPHLQEPREQGPVPNGSEQLSSQGVPGSWVITNVLEDFRWGHTCIHGYQTPQLHSAR